MNSKTQSFDNIWEQIIKYCGQTFYTKKKRLPFTYRIEKNLFYPSRTDYHISKNDFKKVFELGHIDGPGQINNLVRGPSYIWAVLNDKRILDI